MADDVHPHLTPPHLTLLTLLILHSEIEPVRATVRDSSSFFSSSFLLSPPLFSLSSFSLVWNGLRGRFPW